MRPCRIVLLDESGRRLGARPLPEGELVLGRELIAELGGGTDPGVSRRHARILSGADLALEDLGSRNGTFLRGRRVAGLQPLAVGDVVEVSGHRFLCADDAAVEESTGDLFASATLAAARPDASGRLRLVYELTRMIDARAEPSALGRHLEQALARGLPGAEVRVLTALVMPGGLPFAPPELEGVRAAGRTLRRQDPAGRITALALPFGAPADPAGVVLVRAGDAGLSEDDAAFAAAAAALAQTALRVGERELAFGTGQEREIIGQSPALAAALRALDAVAPHAELSVLLRGETGTGKELFARRVHARSGRGGPFVAVNLAALSPELLEAELFGHKKGAFTGADRARTGYVELAHRGTLFLDEIGEIPPAVQVKLLRVLQERTICRVGDSRVVPVDLRLVSATNADLSAKIAVGRFREDLYYRLADHETRLPPLRERAGDVRLLAEAFVARNRPRTPMVRAVDPEALAVLEAYAWPGNVRQLEGVIRLAAIHAAADGAELISPEHLDERVREAAPRPAMGPAGRELEAAERAVIVKALAGTRGNKRAAARELGMSINTLRSRLARHGITEDDWYTK